MNNSKEFIPLKLSMLQNSKLTVYVKMAQNMIKLEELNSDRSFIDEFVLRNKENEQFFFVKRTDFDLFIKTSNKRVKTTKDVDECIHLLSAAGQIMFENFKANALSESSLQDGFELVQYTITGESKQYVSEIIKSLASSKEVGVQTLVRSMICFLTAQSLGWQREKNYQNLIIGSLLADIGNVFSPEQPHPENSLAFLGPYSDHSDIPSIVKHHHENFDGSGPLGLTRHKIHPLAKLLRLSDNIAQHSPYSLADGISSSLAEQRNLFEKDPISKLHDYLKGKKMIKT